MSTVTTFRRHPVATSTTAALGAIALLWVLNGLLPDGSWQAHAGSHLAVALPLGALLLVIRASWPAPRPSKVALLGRRVTVAGLAAFVAAGLLEAVAARVEYPVSGTLHDSAGMFGLVALLVLVVGLGLSGWAVARAGAMPRWVVVVAATFGALALVSLTMGLPIS